MATLIAGDRVRYTGAYWRGSPNDTPEVGEEGTVIQDTSDAWSENVYVMFDKSGKKGVFPQNVELIPQDSDAASVAEDPRTPETVYADSVDELLHKYADDLHAAMKRGTMAYPYSHVGIFAEFLMEYNAIPKP